MRPRRWAASLVVLVVLGTATAASSNDNSARTASAGCASGYSSTQTPGNPLALNTAPGSNPLNGARFFVDGPRHGSAAGAIGQLVGINTANYADDVSWAAFEQQVTRALRSHPKAARNVALLEKIASEPEAQRISSYTDGGVPSGITAETDKLLCDNITADPGSVMMIDTYFMRGTLKGRVTAGQIYSYMPLFEQRVNAMVNAIGNHPVLMLLEEDAIGTSYGLKKNGALPAWEAMLRYEVDKVASLPHAVAYVEAGYSDANTPAYTAKVLNAVGVDKIRGFWTNDTHLNWTINEINWGDKISKLTDGAHFVINTGENGNGPKRNAHPHTEGVEDLCNAPGRALGPKPTTNTGFAQVDAFLWSSVPGNSSGCGGGPPGGDFWPAKAEGLAARANGRLGPHYKSAPY
jgi:endoglucanase